MPDEQLRAQISRKLVAQRKDKEFQEVPGETEADAVRDAFLRSAGPEPGRLASALTHVDPATRARAVGRLQEVSGNSYMQRVAAEARGEPGRLVGLSQSEMVEEVQHRKGSGSPLSETARQPMEGLFGAPMDSVRVHSDAEAAALSRELDASAFTVGQDVFFAEGRYDPSSTEGQSLLAHELTHVGQQTGFGGQGVQRQDMPEEEEEVQRQDMPEEEEEAPLQG